MQTHRVHDFLHFQKTSRLFLTSLFVSISLFCISLIMSVGLLCISRYLDGIPSSHNVARSLLYVSFHFYRSPLYLSNHFYRARYPCGPQHIHQNRKLRLLDTNSDCTSFRIWICTAWCWECACSVLLLLDRRGGSIFSRNRHTNFKRTSIHVKVFNFGIQN